MTVPRIDLPPTADAGAVLDQRARALARPVDDRPAEQAGELHVMVRVGDHRLAVPAGRARHCWPARPLAPLPAPSAGALVGLAPASGGVIAVADLAELLGVSAEVPVGQRSLLVVDDGAEPFALLVDALEGLAAVEPTSPGADALTSTSSTGVRVLHVDAVLGALGAPDLPSSDPSGALP